MPGLGGRRWGRTERFDVFNNSTGLSVARNISAATAIGSYATSLTAEELAAGVAAKHSLVSDGYFVAAHMAVLGGPLSGGGPAPVVHTALVDKTGSEEVPLSPYQFPADAFWRPDNHDIPLTYTAKLSSGAALPAWLIFTPGTRTFSGTPANNSAGVYTVRVTAADPWGQTVYDDFTYTISA
jgi:hypothetical protein